MEVGAVAAPHVARADRVAATPALAGLVVGHAGCDVLVDGARFFERGGWPAVACCAAAAIFPSIGTIASRPRSWGPGLSLPSVWLFAPSTRYARRETTASSWSSMLSGSGALAVRCSRRLP